MHLSKRIWASATLAATLVACGGGSAITGSVATVTGVAATGLAIVGGKVTLKCVSGTATTPATGADGSYTIDVSNVTLPCVARVEYTDANGNAQQLHSLVATAGTTNITPVTELLVANVTGASASAAFDSFDAAAIRAIDTTRLNAAAVAVKSYLRTTLGVDVANLPDDFLSAKFKPKSSPTATDGDAFDAVLDAFKAKLTATGKTLGTVATEFLANAGGSGTAGYPTAATFTGRLSDGSACTVAVAADHTVTVSAASWPYSGSISTTLDGMYFQNTNSEIAPTVTYTGTSRFYESSTGSYSTPSAGTPYLNTGLRLDATSGQLVMAMGQAITDSSYAPAVGANFSYTCVGDAYPAGATVAQSKFNTAPASNFVATNLVSAWGSAPSDAAGTQACSVTVDATGNATITSANFQGGALTVPYTRIDTNSTNDASTASYSLYSAYDSNGFQATGADAFTVTLRQASGVKTARVMVNGIGVGTSVNGQIPTGSHGEKSIECSTANDPNTRWAQVAAYAGTWVGTKNINYHFGSNASCTLVVANDGSMTYTDTNSANTPISVAAWTVTPPASGAYFDFAKTGTAYTFGMDFTGTTVQGGQPQAFFWKSGGNEEYCNNMVKQ